MRRYLWFALGVVLFMMAWYSIVTLAQVSVCVSETEIGRERERETGRGRERRGKEELERTSERD